jgi:hypothetical protein
MDPSIERALAERSAAQLGLITDVQLRDLDVDRRRRARLEAGGWLVRVGTRTYRVGAAPDTWESRVLLACLDVDGVASHRTAARLHPLPSHPWARVPIEVTIRKGRGSGESDLAIVHTSTSLPIDDIVQVGPIPTTSIARTVLGLAALVPEVALDDVREVIDVAVQQRLASDEWLWWLLERRRCRGRNGVSTLEDLLSDRAGRGRTESWLERTFLEVVAAGGFVLPQVQRRIRARGAFVARVDAFWSPDLIAEVSGAATHTTRRQQSVDAARRTRLGAAGFRFLEFTYDQVVHDRPFIWAVLAQAGVPSTARSNSGAKPF